MVARRVEVGGFGWTVTVWVTVVGGSDSVVVEPAGVLRPGAVGLVVRVTVTVDGFPLPVGEAVPAVALGFGLVVGPVVGLGAALLLELLELLELVSRAGQLRHRHRRPGRG